MIAYQNKVGGFRFVDIRQGDTLQAIAARELGDAARWVDLVAFNGLVPPFLTDDSSQAGTGVLLYGSSLRVPAPAPIATATTDPDRVFELDVLLSAGGAIGTVNGDFAIADGRTNLRQALVHRVSTDRGELGFHPLYGSLLRRLIGSINGPTALLLAAEYAKSAVRADPRISRVTKADAVVVGDAITVSVEAEPIVGRVITLTATL
jgi:phage baseplate assembly protein W